ncbi:MAG: chromosomal replication initiator protein DnaA [Bacilli bacterium]|nr:chromosomal replication initiator protein DnaA [Bacilli bacterium]
MVTTLSEITKLWEKTLKKVDQKMNHDPSFDYFFANSYIYEKRGNTLIVVAPTLVAKTVIMDKYHDLVIDSLLELEDEEFEIEVVTEEDINKIRESGIKKEDVNKEQSNFFADAKIRPELTFDNFVVGDFNKDAHRAAYYVAKNDDKLFNPLFIYSHSGLGKTHLMHAIANEVLKERMPNAKILYITANDFVEDYIKFIRAEKDQQSLKSYFKSVDILLLDDVQFLANKVKTQEMFFYIYQDMINKGKQVILTSDRQPGELRGLEDRLVTRFSQGLTVKINEPDIDTCVEIVKEKITSYGMDIKRFDDNVFYLIAEKFSGDVRDLEGAAKNLKFDYMNLKDNERITLDIAIKAVSSKGDGKKIINQINGQKIISIVADYYNLTPSQITGKERNAQLVLARHLSMYLIRKYIDIPLKKIGEMFGGKDHTTVMSAITKVDKELKTDAQLQSAVEDLEKKIKE